MLKNKDIYDIEKQHTKGKLHAIERIQKILDPNTFCEFGSNIGAYQNINDSESFFPYDGVITGYGYIDKQLVFIYSQDFTVCGGTVGKKHGKKIASVVKKAIENKCPVIGINDSGGARIQEGVNSLAAYGDIFYYNTLASGYIPQISIILGPCAGGAVYSPGITDFIFMVKDISNMFVTGPKVIEEVTGKKCNAKELGGAEVHGRVSGVSHFTMNDEKSCFIKVRQLISILPPCAENKNCIITKYNKKLFSKLDILVPTNSRQVYNMLDVVNEIVDVGSFIELQKNFAENIIIGFGKLSEIMVGIVANQPRILGGILECDSSDKAARFIRYCDAYNIPIITLVDVPGFLPSIDQEKRGIIRHGAKLLYAYSEATTIKLTIILRKAYGGAYIAMGSKHLGADYVYAWPKAEISVMGAEGAINIIYNKQLNCMENEEREKFRIEKIEEYKKTYMNSRIAEREGYIDEVISPNETRERIFRDIVALQNKKKFIKVEKKHGNIPL